MIRIRKGLDLPIEGQPSLEIDAGAFVRRVALVGDDYVGLKPKMAVQVGDRVKLGQALLSDKSTPEVQFTSPGCGKVVAINRGSKRRFLSIEIELEGDDQVTFSSYEDHHFAHLARQQVRDNLVQSGLWTALRTRPYSRVPQRSSSPASIFVAAMDTNPLAAPAEVVIAEYAGEFQRGLELLSTLTDGNIFVCTKPGAEVPAPNQPEVRIERFEGPHPAGLPGTHIHLLDPVGPNKTVWTINYQDVIAFGRLFRTGQLPVDRIISLAGPAVSNPRLLRTRLGASVDDLVAGQLVDGETRVISGSVLSGRAAEGPRAYLGRFHLQISALAEGDRRVLLEWIRLGLDRFSVKSLFASAVLPRTRQFAFTTSQEGSPRAMVPIGSYEKIMPLDILPTYLLRALIVGDTQQAQALGCLELDEEDLALCSFVCLGKYEYGPLLRGCLQRIEQEG